MVREIDCPSCGIERIRSNVSQCSTCEIADRLNAQATAYEEEIGALKAERDRLRAELEEAKRDAVRYMRIAAERGTQRGIAEQERDEARAELAALKTEHGHRMDEYEAMDHWIRTFAGDEAADNPTEESALSYREEFKRCWGEAERFRNAVADSLVALKIGGTGVAVELLSEALKTEHNASR